jgi:putative acetyltransferase
MQVVPVAPAQHAAVAALIRAAFGRDAEDELVSRLREGGLMLVELAMAHQDKIIGHILFGRLIVEIDGRAVTAASLAPVSVQANRQRKGIGTDLVREGLAALRAQGCEAVIVVGHPAYYARFGFSATLARKLTAPFKGEAFMATGLTPGSLAGHAGSVSYPAAFDVVQNS